MKVANVPIPVGLMNATAIHLALKDRQRYYLNFHSTSSLYLLSFISIAVTYYFACMSRVKRDVIVTRQYPATASLMIITQCSSFEAICYPIGSI